MQEGSLRADINVSVHKPGEPFRTRTEMKNMNSFRSIVRAIDYEAQRQIDVLENGGVVEQETLRWDDVSGRTFSMRDKEDAEDYRYFPEPDLVAIKLSEEYDKLRKKDKRFKSDGKAQITGYYEGKKLTHIKTFTISYQNDELNRNETDKIIKNIVLKICNKYKISIEEFLINPTGRFEIGGFDGDAGVTGRKILVDNYHSFSRVGGGAFSGKDPTKVDRSGAYKAREIAKKILIEKKLEWCSVQISYAIGKEKPLSIYIDSNIGQIEVNNVLYEECTPRNIINDLNLLNIKYYDKAKFGHFIK
jgi:S-adenosylmethionine synthetase